MITPLELEKPQKARLRPSGKMRRVIMILGLGTALLVVVLSVLDAIGRWRAENSPPAAPVPATLAETTEPAKPGDSLESPRSQQRTATADT